MRWRKNWSEIHHKIFYKFCGFGEPQGLFIFVKNVHFMWRWRVNCDKKIYIIEKGNSKWENVEMIFIMNKVKKEVYNKSFVNVYCE